MYLIIDKDKPYQHLENDSDTEDLGLNWRKIHRDKLAVHDELRKLNLLVNEKKKKKKVAQRASTTEFQKQSSPEITTTSYRSGQLSKSEIEQLKKSQQSNRDSGHSSISQSDAANSSSGVQSDNSSSDNLDQTHNNRFKKPVSRYDLYKPKRRSCSGTRLDEKKRITTKSKTVNMKSLLDKFEKDRHYSTNSDDSRENYDFPENRSRRSSSLDNRKLQDLKMKERKLREYQKELDKRSKKIAEMHEKLEKKQRDILRQENELEKFTRDLAKREKKSHKSYDKIAPKRRDRRRKSRSSSKNREKKTPKQAGKSSGSSKSNTQLSDKEKNRAVKAIEKQERSRRRAKEESLLESNTPRRKDKSTKRDKKRQDEPDKATTRRRRGQQPKDYKYLDPEYIKKRYKTHV